MTADERIEELLNEAGETIEDIKKNITDEDIASVAIESRKYGSIYRYSYILVEIINRMQTALHNALLRNNSHFILHDIYCKEQYECVNCGTHFIEEENKNCNEWQYCPVCGGKLN